jgi:3-oxoacyl-[acyl-carrier-protein] synthase-1
MSNNETIHVVGIGARTPVGLTAPASAAAVRAGINRISEHPYMIDKAGEPMIVAKASYISDEIHGAERFLALSLPAAHEALTPLLKLMGKLPPISLIVGLPAQRRGLPTGLAEEIATRFKSTTNDLYRFSEIASISSGHAAGLIAIEEGWRRIRNGSVELCLAGGVDSYLEPLSLELLDFEGQLHSSTNKWGFIPGEAAGFCLLASQRAVERYQLRILGKLLAIATDRETNLIKTDSVCIGTGLTKAFKQVLQVLTMPNRKVAYVICDINGEIYRANEYGFTLAGTSDCFVDATAFLAPADRWGDIGAASGPLFLNLALIAGQRGYAKGALYLISTSSEGGERCVALAEISMPTSRFQGN